MAIEPAALTGQTETATPSLRDTLDTAFESARVGEPEPVAAPEPSAAPAAPEAKPDAKADAPKADSSGRLHAADGKFTPKADAPKADAQAPAVERPKRPDSWKKDYWDHWDKLDPAVAKYIHEREQQYLNGVTTYKQEWERAKPLMEAIQPYQQLWQQNNITPQQFIKSLADTHSVLSGGDVEAKKRAFAQFAHDYGVPLEQLFYRGEDGNIYRNDQYFNRQQPAQAQQAVDPALIVRQEMAKLQLQQMVQNFANEKGADGQPAHPHFEKVKETMDGLLRARLATDLQGAYEAALAMPKHAELAAADRQQREEREQSEKARAAADVAARARANAASPRSSAPTTLIPDGKAKQGLRSQLEAAYDNAAGGRV